MKVLSLLTGLVFSIAGMASMAGAPEVGDMAPDFTLQGSDGKTYTLSDYRGKQAVVVAWFPRAYTSGCTVECKSLAEKGHLIREYDVSCLLYTSDAADDN